MTSKQTQVLRTEEALKMADDLDSEFAQGRISNHTGRKAAQMLRALAQPAVPQGHEQSTTCGEPVAYGMWDSMIGCGGRMMYVRLDKGQDGCTIPLYTTPPKRKPLTDEQRLIEMVDAAMVATRDIVPRITRSQCRLIIEAAHSIKE